MRSTLPEWTTTTTTSKTTDDDDEDEEDDDDEDDEDDKENESRTFQNCRKSTELVNSKSVEDDQYEANSSREVE